MLSLRKTLNFDVKRLPTVYTSVRWATKPRWVPMAKTKIFRIPPPRYENVPEVEVAENRQLYNFYRTQLKSTLSLLRRVYRQRETSEEVLEKLRKEEEDAWQRSMALNDEWNRQVALERERLDALEYEKAVEDAKVEMEDENERRRLEQQMVDDLIREQKELSSTFITAENINEHVHKILNVDEPSSFNWAIDLEGNVYEGFNSTPSPDKKLVARNTLKRQST